MVSGDDDVHESLQILLATRLGERVMREDYGCNLDDVVFDNVDRRMINRVTTMVRDAILYHETRITLESLEVRPDPVDRGLLRIHILYRIARTNSRYNMVYDFYTREAIRGV